LNDLKGGQYVAGIEDILTMVNEFPKDLANCKNMDDDITAIESWA